MSVFVCKKCGGQPCLYEDQNSIGDMVDLIRCPQDNVTSDWQEVDGVDGVQPLLEVALKHFDFEKEMTGIDKEDSPEVAQLRLLVEALA